MLTMTLWQTCRPLLLLLSLGGLILTAVKCHRKTIQQEQTLPQDALAELFRDKESPL